MTANQIPAIVNEWIAHFESETGHRPTDTAIRIASLSYELGRQMADRGHHDKQIGREPLPFATFEATAWCIIAGTTDTAIKCGNVVAQLLYDKYMIGYNGKNQ